MSIYPSCYNIAFNYNSDGTASVRIEETLLRDGEDPLKRLKTQIQHLFDIIVHLNETIAKTNQERDLLRNQSANLQFFAAHNPYLGEYARTVQVQQQMLEAQHSHIAELQTTIDAQQRAINELRAQIGRGETARPLPSPHALPRRTSVSPISDFRGATPIHVSSATQTDEKA